MEPFIAQILLFAGNFAPRGWAFCEGQLLPIAQNSALFSLIGTTYGGDGRTTFGLPDLRGRVPISPGNGPGLPGYNWGQKGGSHTETLTVNQIPSHTHAIGASSQLADDNNPRGRIPGVARQDAYASSTKADGSMASPGSVGGNQSHNNMQPYLAMYYIIALQGIFPSRS
ncbi:MAG: tail fiber protein [Pseudomonadota bacterium]